MTYQKAKEEIIESSPQKTGWQRSEYVFVIRIYVVFLSGYVSGIDVNEQQ